MDAVGHLNPMLALVDAFAAHATRPKVRVFGAPSAATLFCAAGVTFENRADHRARVTQEPMRRREQREWTPGQEPARHAAPSALAVHSFLTPQRGLADLVRRVAAFRPDVVVHDVFDLAGKVAAHALGVPAAAALIFAGLRALGEDFAAEHTRLTPDIQRANARMSREFGLDVLGGATCLPVLFPSMDLSMVTAIKQQSPPRRPGTERLTEIERSLGSALVWTGPWIRDIPSAPEVPGFPWDRIRQARAAGRRVVLFSLGTNIVSFRRQAAMGGVESGEAFASLAQDLLLDAFDHDGAVQLVVATGTQDWPRADRARAWPADALRSAVIPQRRLLADGVDAFITHHGYNSTVEAILSGTRMVAFPGYGDQIANAEFCVRAGLSVAYWDLRKPAQTCEPAALRQAVYAVPDLAAPGSWRRSLLDTGGADLGANLVLGLAS